MLFRLKAAFSGPKSSFLAVLKCLRKNGLVCCIVYLSDIERGQRKPPAEKHISRLANLLEADPPELLNLANRERGIIELDLHSVNPKQAQAAMTLARRWNNLSDKDTEIISSVMNTKNPAKPEISKDEITLHLIAGGLISLTRTTEDGTPLKLPYPKHFSTAWTDLLSPACIRKLPLRKASPTYLTGAATAPWLTGPLTFPMMLSILMTDCLTAVSQPAFVKAGPLPVRISKQN